ncbi:MAG: hypothetical protein ABII01_05995 [Candidatus Woesearchaeota archaeon]
MAIIDLSSGFAKVWFYVTLSLVGLLVLLLIILLLKKFVFGSKKNTMKKHLEDQGFIIIEKEFEKEPSNKEKKSFFRKGKKELSVEQELRLIFNRLNEIHQREKLSKKTRNQVFSEEIENLYKSVVRPEKWEREEKPVIQIIKDEKKADNEGISKEVKQVLKITDELMEKLPEDVINEFVKSKEFKIYQKVVKEAKK